MKELDSTQLYLLASDAYKEFVFSLAVTNNANVSNEDKKTLIARTESMAATCETVCEKVLAAVEGARGDDVLMLRQSMNDYKKRIAAFRKEFGVSNSNQEAGQDL